jgi:hypothetical protein
VKPAPIAAPGRQWGCAAAPEREGEETALHRARPEQTHTRPVHRRANSAGAAPRRGTRALAAVWRTSTSCLGRQFSNASSYSDLTQGPATGGHAAPAASAASSTDTALRCCVVGVVKATELGRALPPSPPSPPPPKVRTPTATLPDDRGRCRMIPCGSPAQAGRGSGQLPRTLDGPWTVFAGHRALSCAHRTRAHNDRYTTVTHACAQSRRAPGCGRAGSLANSAPSPPLVAGAPELRRIGWRRRGG